MYTTLIDLFMGYILIPFSCVGDDFLILGQYLSYGLPGQRGRAALGCPGIRAPY
jgi:hypothetical protein